MSITKFVEIDVDIDELLEEMSSSEKTELCAQLIEEGYADGYFPDGISNNPRTTVEQAWVHSLDIDLPKPLVEFLEDTTGKTFGRC
ncbi:hypothetical protein [Vitreoscilla stercoraria]|uniref:Uncharacterized protein n=1 Tax=Vitreoscilla stercoraria TaxID=61 RepID=A0ABY4EDB1_VITST|nr:hypothetical protein [Vitreoscilla stercoraria]UOO93359.1 hypothetical protein LVJ81_04850 [Vitreoscilla stercoraria]